MDLQIKVPTTYTEQLIKLKERGCVIEDEAACCEALKSLYPDVSKWNTEVLLPIQALFEEYAEDIDLYHMAFPVDWQEQLRK